MLDERQRYVIADPYPFVLGLERCHGMWLVTMDGQEVFDWDGYPGSKLLGHHHPRLADPAYLPRLALAAANKVPNPDFLTPQRLACYRLIHEPAPVCMRNERLEVYAVNSGAEAIENMMKSMISLHHEKLETKGRNGVVYMLHPMRDRGIPDSTWGGSLADTVRFVEEMTIVQEEDLIAQVPAKAAHLEAGLCELAGRFGHLISNPWGMGLYQGFTMRQAEWKARLLESALQEENLLLPGAGRYSVRLRPPINVTIADIDEMLSRLGRVLQRLKDEVAATCVTAA